MGQQIAVALDLKRKNRLPIGTVRVRLVFENVLYGEQEENEVWLQPGEEREMTFVHLYEAADCGNVRTHAAAAEYRDLLGLAAFKGVHSEQIIPMLCITIIMIIPPILVFLFAQKYIVEGTSGSIK